MTSRPPLRSVATGRRKMKAYLFLHNSPRFSILGTIRWTGRYLDWTLVVCLCTSYEGKEARQIPEPVSNTNQQNTGGTGDWRSPLIGVAAARDYDDDDNRRQALVE